MIQPPAHANLDTLDPKQTYVVSTFKYDAPLITCRIDPTGRYVFAAAENNTVVRWTLGSGEAVVFRGHESWPRAIAFSNDGKFVVTGASDDCLIWWETEATEPKPVRKVVAHKGWIRCLRTHPEGKLLVSGGNDNLVKIWDMETGSQLDQLQGHERNIYSLGFHPNGEILLSGDLMGQVHQWEWATKKRVRTFDAKALHTYNGGQRVDYGGVRSIAFNPEATHVTFGGLHKATNPLGAISEPLVLRFDWESQKLLKSHVANGVRGAIWDCVYHPTGSFLLGGSGGGGGGFLLFWNAEDEKEFHKFKLPNTARGMDLHPDGLQVATAHYDRQLRVSKMAAKPPETQAAK